MIKNYTTVVSEEKTMSEIMGLLAAKGARSVRIDYDERNRPAGIGFIVLFNGVPIPFKLPANFGGVYKVLFKCNTTSGMTGEREMRSRRVAWRIIKDWVAAQMALIEAEQASLIQVFLPYFVQGDGSGVTMYDRFIEHVSKTKALPAASA